MGEIEAYYSWRRIVYHRAVSAFHTQAYALAAFLHERLGARFADFVRGAVEQGCGPRQLAAALGTTPDGLALVGPGAFDYDFDYRPVTELGTS